MVDREVVFDLDGTIVDSVPMLSKALKEFSEENNLPHDIIKMAMGYTYPEKNDLGWGLSLDRQIIVYDQYTNYYLDKVEAETHLPPLYPEIKEVISGLSGAYNLSINTLSPRKIARLVMQKHAMDHFFDEISTLCCAHERNHDLKPSADSLNYYLMKKNCLKENAVLVGDSKSDIDMARNAGIRSIGVLYSGTPREKLKDATALAETVAELPGLIKTVFDRPFVI